MASGDQVIQQNHGATQLINNWKRRLAVRLNLPSEEFDLCQQGLSHLRFKETLGDGGYDKHGVFAINACSLNPDTRA